MRTTLLLAASLFVAKEALPCSFAFAAHRIDEAERALDHTAPTPPEVSVTRVTRGVAPRLVNGTMSMTSCDDIGTIAFSVDEPPVDDRSKPEEIGYLVRLVEGTLPEGLELSTTPYVLPGPLVWSDGATNEQEPIEFVVAVVAVDRAGNESVPSLHIRVSDVGSKK